MHVIACVTDVKAMDRFNDVEKQPWDGAHQ